jgi:maleylacetate reductase
MNLEHVQPGFRMVFGAGSFERLELGADGLGAIGGGSAIGLAKAIALTSHAPMVAVPTTYAGSEMTPVYGLTAEGRKRTGRDEAVRPRTVVYDAELSRDLPPAVAGPSAMKALAHCVDALWADWASPVGDLLAEGGARALREDDHERRLYGAALAGWTFGVVGGALHHRICHLLGGAFDLPHAETHSAVLSHVAALGADDLAQGSTTSPGAWARRPACASWASASPTPTAWRRRSPGRVPLDERAARELLRRAWAGARPHGES